MFWRKENVIITSNFCDETRLFTRHEVSMSVLKEIQVV